VVVCTHTLKEGETSVEYPKRLIQKLMMKVTQLWECCTIHQERQDRLKTFFPKF
jgi:hypothetical protein